MKRVHVFGASGSIGQSTLGVLRDYAGRFCLATLSVHGRTRGLAGWIEEFQPERVAITDPDARERWASEHPEHREKLLPAGTPATNLLEVPGDIALNGILGFAGLEVTLAALDADCDVALANKESLVCGGEFLLGRRAHSRSRLLPVDSEHSALFQLLEGREAESVGRVWITASGGPFRNLPTSDLAAVTPAEALRHPTWKMGPKITVDSATLMNKGLEIIEASLLFDLPAERIGVLVHPSSTAHALVELRDGSLLCQMAKPDMRQPILLALSHPERLPAAYGRLSLNEGLRLDFSPLDRERFPAVDLARRALARGGTAPLALNAADEVAVAAFLQGEIPFPDIVVAVESVLEAEAWPAADSFAELKAADARARERARSWLAQSRSQIHSIAQE